MMHRVFCYGTLKRGGRLHPALRGAKFLRDATIPGRLHQMPGYWYPQATPGDGIIHGELFGDVSDECLEGLDRAEGHPFLYRRTEISVEGAPAWVYWYVPDTLGDAPLVPGGNFDVHGK
jgi:gamma-glutamylcyclotransferase (GGCT)/AIG2-like uncharacterized protein YtfP